MKLGYILKRNLRILTLSGALSELRRLMPMELSRYECAVSGLPGTLDCRSRSKLSAVLEMDPFSMWKSVLEANG